MKIAVLIQCHKDPEQVNMMIRAMRRSKWTVKVYHIPDGNDNITSYGIEGAGLSVRLRQVLSEKMRIAAEISRSVR